MVRNDPYLVLGVSATATQAEIAHAYRNRLRAHHPDTRHTTSSQQGDEHLRHVLDAYALLRDPARRADYDRATVLAATPPAESSRWQAQATRPVQIPITYADTRASADPFSAPPLRAGPVRRHR
ncbi:MAG TPA: DnaJ domain-containing protein [Mycobacterium sp.]